MADKIEWNGDEPETTYDPSSVEVDRGRQQGLGMGARDLARQRDPGDDETPETPQTDEEASDSAPDTTR